MTLCTALFILAAIICTVLALLIAYELATAPHGYEDDTGFHTIDDGEA